MPLLSDRGAPHGRYFAQLDRALRERGPGRPALVLDLDAVDRNLATVRRRLAPHMHVRIVAKSLPCVPLLRRAMRALVTTSLMVFDDSAGAIARALPHAQILHGKPLPIRAVERFYAEHRRFGERVQWLVDEPRRLRQLQDLARGLGVKIRVNLEIDVGLHRGGFPDPEALVAALRILAGDPEHLSFGGLMGYDAHVAAAPTVLSSLERAHRTAAARYRAFVDATRTFDAQLLRYAVLNGAGSKTYALHRDDGPVNEVSLGSALVMPSDFDVPSLEAHEPALFLAAPVLKRMDGTRIPFLERGSRSWGAVDPQRQVTYFLFGGGWLARPHSPQGLEPNPLYGFSTNQSMLNGSRRTGLRPDDHVFFRPTQSERVMQEFPDLLLVQGGELAGRWSPLPLSR